ncbi:hypothetical protein VTK73DRAFT_10226 [Phialemonium thermophilum]|uniref:Uncharacterized protein n=1 Tax=Phialemonium thermophilum TaxID=223376 RepID=A0ABR3XHM3_9PEZI
MLRRLEEPEGEMRGHIGPSRQWLSQLESFTVSNLQRKCLSISQNLYGINTCISVCAKGRKQWHCLWHPLPEFASNLEQTTRNSYVALAQSLACPM